MKKLHIRSEKIICIILNHKKCFIFITFYHSESLTYIIILIILPNNSY